LIDQYQIKIQPTQYCLIDDNLTNTEMAKQAGFAAIYNLQKIVDLLL